MNMLQVGFCVKNILKSLYLKKKDLYQWDIIVENYCEQMT